MGFTVEQECPQCGAPIELEETDHLIRCPYCNVKNFLYARDYFRFLLPHKASDKDILYAPYMRFKGKVYFCRGTSIGHRILDITHQGAAFKQLPASLGLRPQVMKMKFVSPAVAGSFLKCSIGLTDVLTKAGKHPSLLGPGKLIHRAYIGEALSLIYLPLFVRDGKVFDAVTNRSIAKLPQGEDIFGPAIDDKPRWQITFMATICPQCGWNLDGERDSVVLTCSNCDTVWEASKGKFIKVGFRAAQSIKITFASSVMIKKKIFPLLPRVSFYIKESTLVYLPFNDTGHEMVQEHMPVSINKRTLEFGRHL